MPNWSVNKAGGDFEAEQAERVAVWKKVAPKPHWKDPIDAWIDAADFDECCEAAIWFAGSPLEIVARRKKAGTDQVRVQGGGYYECIGA